MNKVDKPVVPVQRSIGQQSPAEIAPSLESMRPDPSHNPTVQSVEEFSDVSLLVVVAPTTQDRIQSLNQFLGFKRHASPGERAYPIHEAANRLLAGKRIQRP